MENKNIWVSVIIATILIIFVIVSIKFKLTEKFGWWMFVFFMLFFALIFVFLYFKPLEHKRKGMSNREVILRINELLSDTPGGVGLNWDGGASNKMGYRDFEKNKEKSRFWGVIAKSKDSRWFRIIYSELDDVLISVDGATSTESIQDLWINFKPYSSDENELMQKMMMSGMFGRNSRYGSPRKRTIRMNNPTDPFKSENDEFGEMDK